jgi:glyoxylase-like metal-dependent hydrolase (beta-lactamase superfamily II)
MLFQPFFFQDVNEVNTYIIGCPDTKECILIDAGADCADYDKFLEQHNAKLTAVFLTHIHWDHDQALDEIAKRFDIPVYSMPGDTINGKIVTEGDSVPIGKLNNHVLITTGHTPNSLSLVVENKIAFVGDAIFAGSIGGTSNDELKQEEIGHIQNKLFALPENCLLCSGHGPITTVSIEKNANPFVCMA